MDAAGHRLVGGETGGVEAGLTEGLGRCRTAAQRPRRDEAAGIERVADRLDAESGRLTVSPGP